MWNGSSPSWPRISGMYTLMKPTGTWKRCRNYFSWLRTGCCAAERGHNLMSAGFPSLLQSFFSDRLLRQRQASPHTIGGYRDSFRLLFQFAKQRLGKAPSSLTLDDLNPSFV